MADQFFDINDKTALVCVDNIEWQNQIVNSLTEMGYKIHIGVFPEDILAKMQSHPYNVVVIAENFMGETLDTNVILKEVQTMSMNFRRFQVITLVGDNMVTGDRVTSFIYSVNLTINSVDLEQFSLLLRKTLAEDETFYHTFRSVQKMYS